MPTTADLLTLAEAARALGITPDALRGAVMRGTLAVVPLDGRTNLVAREEVERYRAEHLGRRGKRKGKKTTTQLPGTPPAQDQ